MKLNSLSCPNCGASVEIEDGIDTFFCKYCGYKIILEGQSDAAYRAKIRVKGMEHDERMVDKKYAQERYKIEHKAKEEHAKVKRTVLIVLACVLAYVVLFVGYFGGEERKSKKQEAELQQLVDEIQVNIENEDFDTAYIKAKQIQYTEGWSSEIEDKWDETRRTVIDQIISSEKKATGKSEHKPEKKGWFD